MKKVVSNFGKPTKRIAKVAYEKPVKMGAFGPEVQYICSLLQKKGSTITMTDRFHIGMRSAIVSFQKKNKLKVTGVVDKKTWDKLVK